MKKRTNDQWANEERVKVTKSTGIANGTKKTKWFNRTSENPNLCLNRSQSAEDEELIDYTFYHFNIESSKYKLVT